MEFRMVSSGKELLPQFVITFFDIGKFSSQEKFDFSAQLLKVVLSRVFGPEGIKNWFVT